MGTVFVGHGLFYPSPTDEYPLAYQTKYLSLAFQGMGETLQLPESHQPILQIHAPSFLPLAK